MEQQQPKQNAGHGNGFILGVIVGVIISLLFTTKRGREILRDVSEKGIEKLSDLEQLTKEYQGKDFLEDDEELLQEDDYVEKEPVAPAPAPKPAPAKVVKAPEPVKEAPAKVVQKPAPQPEVEHEVIEPVEEKKKEKTITGRRWFRGLRKKG